MIGKITIALITALVALIIGVRMIAQRAPRPDRMGVVSGRLVSCPDKPNCVSTFEGAAPFAYEGSRDRARDALFAVLTEWPRTELIQTRSDYIHVEFRSRIFSFIDDGEFYLPDGENVIHYRAAARTGNSAMGVNTARMDDIWSKIRATKE